MNNTKNNLASLALDLSRVALGLNRGSESMAKRFFQEALARKSEINVNKIPVYITKIMAKINKDIRLDKQFSEEVQVYSTLIENYVTRKM